MPIKNDKEPFTIDDFKKGLMLLGLVAAQSPQEKKEKEALEAYENTLAKEQTK